ncbi:NACHT domain-containing protein [Streptomyces sp. NPDC002763]|uniref:NACHT domain-containing protein n=1 Tax=Streptomyces sp. NPDC002763 TaxID=3154427 RepID=UPI0033321E3D
MREPGEAKPDFGQPSWRVEGTVINAGEVRLSPAADPSAGTPHTAPPPPSDEPAFRRSLARLLLRKLRSTGGENHWLSDELTELTAIVEDVGGQLGDGRRRGLRRRPTRYSTQPLAQALAHPDADLILLQGVAGSGKSVALRQHALSLLEQIESGRAPGLPLPVYVNLRELVAKPHEINTELLRRYVMEQTGPHGNADIASYFTHCFAEDLRNRRVVLLFDSFDEIPAVLGSATVDAVVAPYVETIIELVGGGGRCVVACREYKGLRTAGWTQLHILGMSLDQQESFLDAAHLDSGEIDLVRPLLADPRRGFAGELQNPLSLRLLATYVQSRRASPDRPTALFAEYAALRIRAGFERVGLDPDGATATDVRPRLDAFLDHFAFQLTASGGGLSVAEGDLVDALAQATRDAPDRRELLGRVLTESRILGFSSTTAEPGGRRVFFGHRRVQQFFASRYVATHPSAVAREELATNGRWRETAVTVLQGGAPEVTEPLLETLAGVLAGERDLANGSGATDFEWSPAAVHCLELLTAAYQGRADWPYAPVRPLIEELVEAAWSRGSVSDRKFALDCLPLLSEGARETYIDLAFSGDSDWIRMTAVRDCATLPTLSSATQASIRRLLITRLGRRTSKPETQALDVDLRRLPGTTDFVSVRRVLDRTPRLVVVLALLGTILPLVASTERPLERAASVLPGVAMCIAFFWVIQSCPPLSYGGPRSFGLLARIGRFVASTDSPDVLPRVFGFFSGVVILASVTKILALSLPAVREQGLESLTDPVGFLVGWYAVCWGPSVLYAAYDDRITPNTGVLRQSLLVTESLRQGVPFLRTLLNWRRLVTHAARWWRSLVAMALVSGGLVYLLNRFPAVAGIVTAGVLLTMTAGILNYFLTDLFQTLRSRTRVHNALRSGARGGPAFFTGLLTLRDAREAAEYVRRVRDVPRAGPLDVDRATLRLFIARLRGREAAVSPEAQRRLAKWQDDPELLDELGRLDEQLRPR